jgi:hypothetical protein
MNDQLGGILAIEGAAASGLPAGIPVVQGPAGVPPANTIAYNLSAAAPTFNAALGSVVFKTDGTDAWIAIGINSGNTVWLSVTALTGVAWLQANMGSLQWLVDNSGTLSELIEWLANAGINPTATFYIGQPSLLSEYDTLYFPTSATTMLQVVVKKDDDFEPVPGFQTLDLSGIADGPTAPGTCLGLLVDLFNTYAPSIQMAVAYGGDPFQALFVLTSPSPAWPNDQQNVLNTSVPGSTWSLGPWGGGAWTYSTLNRMVPRQIYAGAFNQVDPVGPGPTPDEATAGNFSIQCFDSSDNLLYSGNYTYDLLTYDADGAGYGGDAVAPAPYASSLSFGSMTGQTIAKVTISEYTPWAFGSTEVDPEGSTLTFSIGDTSIGTINLATGATVTTTGLAILVPSEPLVDLSHSLVGQDEGGSIVVLDMLNPQSTYVFEVQLNPGSGPCQIILYPGQSGLNCQQFISGYQPSSGNPQVSAQPDNGLLLAHQISTGQTEARGVLVGRQTPGVAQFTNPHWACTCSYGEAPDSGDTELVPLTICGQTAGTLASSVMLEVANTKSCMGYLRVTEIPSGA